MKLLDRIVIETRHPELDSFGHVNNANYLRYIEHARIKALGKSGLTLDYFKQRNMIFVVKEIMAHFYFPAGMNELLEIETYLIEYKRITGKFKQVIKKQIDGAIVFSADVHWGIVNLGDNRQFKKYLSEFSEYLSR